MEPTRRLRQRAGVTQARLAHLAGTSQPTIAAYEAGAKSPTLRTLVRLARSVGLEITVSFVPPLTREDRRSLLLHEAIAARLEADSKNVLRRARSNIRRMLAVNPDAAPILREWRDVLARPIPDIVEVLVDSRPHARELRHVTPFAGVLSARDRQRVFTHFREREAAA